MKTDIVADKIYKNSGNSLVLELVGKVAALKVLDVGCGAGDNARELSALGAIIDGITWSDPERRLSERYCRKVFVCDLELGLPMDIEGNYDVIICSHIIEHLRDPTKLLREIRERILSPNGTMVIAVPNFLFATNRIKMLFGNFEYTPQGLLDETHLRWFTWAGIQQTIEQAGYQIVVKKAEGWIPLGPLRRLLPVRFAKAMDTAATKVFPGIFGYQFVVSCH